MQYKRKSSQRRSKHNKVYNELPKRITEKQFERFFLPFLSLPKRSRKFKIPLWRVFNYILYQLRTGCQWEELPIRIDPVTGKKEISYTSVWKWFDRWSGDGSFDVAFTESVKLLHQKKKLKTDRINLDGTNSVAKKGAKTLGIVDISTKKDKKPSG
jgi:transposase